MANGFIRGARRLYVEANAAALRWMLNRSPDADFLDTKQNSITLADYRTEDGLRGPGYTYGWIQGRGLEALTTHARFFEQEDPALSARLDARASRLYHALDTLHRRDGHAYFCYDATLRPVYPHSDGVLRPQAKAGHISTYSDIFVCKGLIAAAACHAPADLPRHLGTFAAIVDATEADRFLMDERRPLDDAGLAVRADDFGPRMILLGAAGMLMRLGLGEAVAYADRFIDHILACHLDRGRGILRNVPGEDICNIGHGIEFVGFALDYLPPDADTALVETLERILISSFRAGFAGPGISLAVSLSSGEPISPYCPWWSLPETIRAAALCHERTGSARSLAVWQEAHDAFFSHYWRGEPPIAYQTLTAEGPVDYVPATPDLDPGYHTGLSLLAAIRVGGRISERFAPG